jgi:hypothetical protein
MDKQNKSLSKQGIVCEVCDSKDSTQLKKKSLKYSPLLSFIILFLPKCPFCIVAYTSSMTMCGTASLINHHTDWGAWLAIGLSIIVLGSIILNFRGKGTYKSILIALIGILMVLIGVFKPNMMSFYYLGSVMLFIAAFYNGSGFRWFNRKMASLKFSSK